jgi:hypothetical protein
LTKSKALVYSLRTMRAEEVHSRVQPSVKEALILRAKTEGVTPSKLIAKLLTQAMARWKRKNNG